MRKYLNLILLSILVAFGGYEITAVTWDEPGEDVMWTLSEWIWNLGLGAQIPAALLMLWAALHFLVPKYDPVLRLMRR